jgi:tetratricopeptide (TPR) repeat protein
MIGPMAEPKPVGNTPRERTAVSASALDACFAHRPWLLALILVVLTLLAYQPVWHSGFIWDDDDHLTANPAMTAPHGLRMIWSSLAVSRYYPLTLTTFWAERQLWGLNPLPFHLVNVVLHGINGILVYFVLRRLRIPAAWLAAMLWTLHPVNVESVAWITEMKNTQSGVFFFCALLCFLRFEAHERRHWYALALLCGAAALLSKPSTVVLPLVLLLCAWWERGGWRRTDLLRTAPFFGLALGMSALTVVEQRGHVLREGTAEWSMGMAERFVVAGKAIWFYAAKLLWPVNLTFVYPRWDVVADSFWSWLPLAGVVAVGIILYQRRREPWARAGAFGLGFFVVALLPVLGFFDVFYFRYSFVADHFQYLAGLGVIALVASLWTRLCELSGRAGKHVNAVAVPAMVILLGLLTWRQAGVYRDVETLWRDTLARNPSCWMAHTNLGTALLQAGKVEEAIGHYEQAVRLKPDPAAEQDYNLGSALLQAGRIDDAIRHFQGALQLKPDYAEAHNNLGDALLQAGQVEGAIGHLQEALRLKPDSALVHYNMGNALSQAGQTEEAIGEYEQALRIKPDYAEAHYNLGNALLQVGRLHNAIGNYEQALQIKPEYAEAHNNLGHALVQAGESEEAIKHLHEALRLQPNTAETHYNLGNALLQLGRVQEAVEQYQQALRIKPDFTEARNALTRLQTGQ